MMTSGNTVLITGGATGIGLALAKEFLARKNSVIVCDLQEEKLASVRREFPEIATVLCDVNSPQDRERLLQTAQKDHGDLNVLVNNAGIVFWHSFLSPEPGLAERTLLEINTNLLAPIELTRLFLPPLLKRERAAIVNVTSGLALMPLAAEPVYCAAKAGLHSFSQSMRYQLKDTSVKVFEVLFSWVDTDMTRHVDTPKMTVDRVVLETFEGIQRDVGEIRIGQIDLLYWMNRLAPDWMFKRLNDRTPPHSG
jgi:short-subunit dehydrogenase involved in D-alanine esterification of teichoic acids